MLRRLSISFTLTAALLAAPAGASAPPTHGFRHLPANVIDQVAGDHAPADHVAGELLVRFRSGAAAAAKARVSRAGGVRSSRALPFSGLRLLRLRRGASVQSAVARLRRDPAVADAQPNNIYRLASIPNDPRFGEQWGLNDVGQVVDGQASVSDADIDAPEAWDLTKGSRSVLVAVADSGIAYDHPDLSPNLWTNPGETGGGRETNGRDDDHDGLVDDWRGWDFVGRDNDPRDLNGHGTHVAGIIGARGDNAFGVAGVDWQVGLMNLRVADSDGVVTDAAIVSAFDYAAAKGARVVNASFVSSTYSDVLREAIRRHPKVLFVAAAGNGDPDGIGDNNDVTPQYPCSFSLVNLVCVAASDQSDRLTTFSNYGTTSVDLAAPGQNVLSTAPAFGPPAFSDGFETPLAGIWTTGGTKNTWARITAVAHGGSYSLSDSPGTTYQNDTDSFVATAAPFSLSGQSGCRVSYALRLSTEPDLDNLFLELSSDGVTWAPVSASSGSSGGAFVDLSDDISQVDGAPSLYLRFRLVTNGSVTGDGAQLDDVSVRCLSSTYAGTEFAFMDGTSMAAPHVTGTAALVLARYPQLGPVAVKEAILRGVEGKSWLAGRVASGGRLDARGALDQARALVPNVRLFGTRRQHALRKRAIVVYARCKQRCVAIVSASVSAGRSLRSVRLKRLARLLPGGRRKRIVIKLTRKARALTKRSLAHHRRVTATVKVVATDSRASSARAKRKITLR